MRFLHGHWIDQHAFCSLQEIIFSLKASRSWEVLLQVSENPVQFPGTGHLIRNCHFQNLISRGDWNSFRIRICHF